MEISIGLAFLRCLIIDLIFFLYCGGKNRIINIRWSIKMLMGVDRLAVFQVYNANAIL